MARLLSLVLLSEGSLCHGVHLSFKANTAFANSRVLSFKPALLCSFLFQFGTIL